MFNEKDYIKLFFESSIIILSALFVILSILVSKVDVVSFSWNSLYLAFLLFTFTVGTCLFSIIYPEKSLLRMAGMTFFIGLIFLSLTIDDLFSSVGLKYMPFDPNELSGQMVSVAFKYSIPILFGSLCLVFILKKNL